MFKSVAGLVASLDLFLRLQQEKVFATLPSP